jgi:hypothetical protein
MPSNFHRLSMDPRLHGDDVDKLMRRLAPTQFFSNFFIQADN